MKRLALAMLLIAGVANGQRIQRMVSQSFPLTNPPSNPAIQNFTLSNNPIGAERIIVAFRSSRIGNDVVYPVSPGVADPKTLEVTVPLYRFFTAQDILTVIYWTYDPL